MPNYNNIGGQDVAKDGVSGIQVMLSAEHNAIHQGIAYTAGVVLTVAAGQTAAFQFSTPASGAIVHLKTASIDADGPASSAFTEDASFSGGTPKVPNNRRRTGTPAACLSTAKFSANTTIVNGANVVELEPFLITSTASGSQKTAGSIKGDEEWYLAQGVNYVLSATNLHTSPIRIGFKVFFYERPTT